MKLKRAATFVLAIASISCISIPAMAANTAQDFNTDARLAAKIAAAEEIAYMDVESASPEMKEEILDARKIIVYNETWIADGYEATATNPDGTRYEVPKFSELFPGWDIPVEQPRNENLMLAGTIGSGDARTYLKNPSSTVNSDPFLTAYGFEETLYLRVKQLDVSETCNFGFTNELTGESVGVFTRKPVGFSTEIHAVPGEAAYLSVRGSTYSTPGYGTFTYDYW